MEQSATVSELRALVKTWTAFAILAMFLKGVSLMKPRWDFTTTQTYTLSYLRSKSPHLRDRVLDRQIQIDLASVTGKYQSGNAIVEEKKYFLGLITL